MSAKQTGWELTNFKGWFKPLARLADLRQLPYLFLLISSVNKFGRPESVFKYNSEESAPLGLESKMRGVSQSSKTYFGKIRRESAMWYLN